MGGVLEYTFMPELTSASGGLLTIITKMRANLSAYGRTVFSNSLSDFREALPNGKASLDLDSVIISKMFHGRSFPAGYRKHFKLKKEWRSLKNGYGFVDNRRRTMDKYVDRQAANTLIHSPA